MGQEDIEPDLNIEALVKYEDVFLEREEQLHRSLNKITEEPLNHTLQEIIRLLNIALSGTGDPDEGFEDATRTFIQLILRQDEEAAERLQEENADPEFVNFILNAIIEYSRDMQRLNIKDMWGDNWWSFIEMDRILGDDRITHQHKITIDRTENITIHSTPRSDWEMVTHFLNSIYNSVQVSGNEDLEMIDIDSFEQVRAFMYAFENMLNNNGIELTDKEDILESYQNEE